MTSGQWFNVITLLVSATFVVTLVPVCVMYASHLDIAPRVREELPTVLHVTAVFFGWMLLSGAAWEAQRRQWPRRMALQGLSYAAALAAAALLYLFLA
jgi:hypothetical protein